MFCELPAIKFHSAFVWRHARVYKDHVGVSCPFESYQLSSLLSFLLPFLYSCSQVCSILLEPFRSHQAHPSSPKLILAHQTGLAFNLPAGMGFTAGLAYGLGASASTSWRLSLAEPLAASHHWWPLGISRQVQSLARHGMAKWIRMQQSLTNKRQGHLK